MQAAEEPDYHCKLGDAVHCSNQQLFHFIFVRPSGLAPLCNVFVAATNSSRRAFSSVAGGATSGGSSGRKERLSLEAPTPRAFSGGRSRVRRKLEKQRSVDGGRGVGGRKGLALPAIHGCV